MYTVLFLRYSVEKIQIIEEYVEYKINRTRLPYHAVTVQTQMGKNGRLEHRRKRKRMKRKVPWRYEEDGIKLVEKYGKQRGECRRK